MSVGVVVMLIFIWVNVPLWRGLWLGVVAALTVFFIQRSAAVGHRSWEPASPSSTRYARRNLDWLLSGLETGLSDPDRFPVALRVRLRVLVEGLLERQDLQLGSAEATALLGSRNIALLTEPDGRRPSRRELVELAGVIARLSDAPTTGTGEIPR